MAKNGYLNHENLQSLSANLLNYIPLSYKGQEQAKIIY